MKKNLTLLLCITMAVNIGCNSRKGENNGYRVGEYGVYILTETQRTGSTDILLDAPESVLALLAPDGTFPNAVNVIMIRKGDEVWLADTGFGVNIFGQMDSLGVKPEQVDHIILTHMHLDHISGMLRDGQPTFPNADVRVSEKEYQYWNSEEEMTNAPEGRRENFLTARKVFEAYGDRIKIEAPYPVGVDLVSGIHMLEAYGHTPGHVAYLLRDGEHRFLIWGDLTHAVAIQTAHPEISVIYDYDPDMARENRMKILEYVSANSIPVAGMHIPFGWIGDVKQTTQGYSFIPVVTQ